MRPESISHLFFDACTRYDKQNAVMVKEEGVYRPYSHRFFKQRVSHFGRGLMSMGLDQGEHVGILAETRFEWAIADLGIISAGGVDVPIYSTLTADQVTWIVNNSESVGIVVSTRDQAEKVLSVKDKIPNVRFIIIMDDDAPEGVLTMRSVEQQGAAEDNDALFESRWHALKSGDLLSILYTSGTTGNPKGVMLTHGNLISNVMSCQGLMPCTSEDIHLSHLPLCHVLERMGGYYNMLYHGVSIAYAEDIKTVAENMLEVKPTVLVSVPRLFEKIYAKVMTNAMSSGFIKRSIFKWAMGIGKQAVPYFNKNEALPGFLSKKWGIADAMVFSKVKEKTGGRLKFMISGGAPLAPEIAELFLGMGLKMVEGYGLTETSPVLAINPMAYNKPGTVGPALPDVELKIAEDGEILARGPNIMVGYFKNPEATADVMEDGWFHTGDIGLLDQDGYLRITDRKKDLIVTSGGKNIAPQPLENALKLSPYIEQAVIIGDNRNFVTALIVPPWETVEEWAASRNWPVNPETLTAHDDFRRTIDKEISERMADFAHYEKVKKFEILPVAFTVETGELTPSMKVKRRVVNDKFKGVVDSMYAD